MKYIIGIDGGATKTKAIVVQEDGKIVTEKIGGAANFQQVGTEGLKRVCKDLLSQLKNDGIEQKDIVTLSLGLAGAGRKEDQKAGAQAINSLGFPQVFVESDAVIALLGAFAGQPGIIVIAGTGSICFGLDYDKRFFRCGGWGYLLGDEGSAYFIGHQAVLAALKDFDSRGKPTILKSEIEARFTLPSIDQIVRKIYIEQRIQKDEIANLAPIVFRCAAEGDAIAGKIVNQAADELAKMILAVRQKMKMTESSVRAAIIGSVFKQKEVLVPRMVQYLSPYYKDILIHEPLFLPEVGAVLMALQKQGKPVTQEILDNLKKD